MCFFITSYRDTDIKPIALVEQLPRLAKSKALNPHLKQIATVMVATGCIAGVQIDPRIRQLATICIQSSRSLRRRLEVCLRTASLLHVHPFRGAHGHDNKQTNNK